MIAAFGGLATGLGALWRARGDQAAALTEVALNLVKPLQTRIDSLEAEVRLLRTENAQLREEIHTLRIENHILRDGVRRLAAQIQSLGHTPVWTPEDEA